MRKRIILTCAFVIGLILLGGCYLLFGKGMSAEGKISSSEAMTRNIRAGRVSVKKYGAVGDGKHNDYDAFNAAINSGKGEIYIPAGTYELAGNTLNVGDGISFIGESQDVCVIKNACISSQYGISVSNITFDGGATKTIAYTGGMPEEGKITFLVSPNGKQSVSYRNCTFKNTTVASFAREESGSFNNVEVDGCTFTNIRRVAVYHSLNIDNAIFTNNEFAGLGGSDIRTGFISALWLGDITNNTYTQAGNVVIQGNKFSNLFTKDDFSDTVHAINANFIAIRSDKATISGNDISNLVGYGGDREAVYTKVRDLTISGNTITNGGMGEGYICNKSQKGDAFVTITGNNISGDAGCAIRNYAPGTISGNSIAISNCPSVITNTLREDITNNVGITISENTINCGTYDSLSVGDTVIPSYSTGQAIRITRIAVPVVVEKNTFNTTTEFRNYIAVGNPEGSVTIQNNSINRKNKDGVGVLVYSTKNGGKLSGKSVVNVNNNKFTGSSSH